MATTSIGVNVKVADIPEVKAAFAEMQAEIDRLRVEVNAGVRVACALESILDSHEDDLGNLIVTEQDIAEANAALDERLGVVREAA